MKIFFIIGSFMLASCATLHKIKTSVKVITDSTSHVIKDTSYVTKTHDNTNIFSAQNIDIDFTYGNDSIVSVHTQDTIKGDNGQPDYTIQQMVRSAITGTDEAGHIPTEVHIHIGSLNDSSVQKSKIDSSSIKSVINTTLKQTITTKNKIVERTGFSIWIYVIGGILIIIFVIFSIFKKWIKF